jgi:hypothetical protein
MLNTESFDKIVTINRCGKMRKDAARDAERCINMRLEMRRMRKDAARDAEDAE